MSTTTSALDSSYSSAISDALKSNTGSSEMDKNAFLMLLCTQFKYQDPLNPMEDKEFVAQLAQFSSLEQTMQTNEKLDTLNGIQEKQTTIGAANYLGREVSARGYGVSVKDGNVSKIEYAAAEEIAKAQANIIDPDTKGVIATIDLGRLAAGSIGEVKWDGRDSSGSPVADGVYTVSIVAWNASGDRISSIDTSVTGTVSAVSYYNGEHYLRLTDGRTVLLSSVREIVDESAKSSTSGLTHVENGEATTLTYKVPSTMLYGTASVYDADGTKVAEAGLGMRTSGKHEFTWDCKLNDGTVAPDGDYTVKFEGRNSLGASLVLEVVG